MCLLAYHPAGSPAFESSMFKHAWSENRDGAGYMFASNGILHIRKPFYKLKDLKRAYKADYAAHGQTSAFVLHFRYSTHGDNTADNVHPHELAGGRVALCHNGVLSDFEPPLKSKRSDTAWFCNTVLAMRTPEQLMDTDFLSVIEVMIGRHNKFVLMDNLGNVQIVNEFAGVWDGDKWFSNESYLPPVTVDKVRSMVQYVLGGKTPNVWNHRTGKWEPKEDVDFQTAMEDNATVDDVPYRYWHGRAEESEFLEYCHKYGLNADHVCDRMYRIYGDVLPDADSELEREMDEAIARDSEADFRA